MDQTPDPLTKQLSQTTGSGPSIASSGTRSTSSTKQSRERANSKGRGRGKGRFLTKMHKITGWLSTSEPSAQALKQHRKDAFQKAGISLNNQEASAKLHAPIGEIPKDAIKPTTGPSPEEAALRRAEQRRRAREQQQQAGGSSAAASGSLKSSSWSGYYSSGPGSKDSASAAPMEDAFGANGW